MNELDQEEDKVINDRGNGRKRVSNKGQKFQINMTLVVRKEASSQAAHDSQAAESIQDQFSIKCFPSIGSRPA
ncbi:hypothetical protein F2Q68_00015956 [Brassica cretica]|uniref:Uncharacterized protein n=1 Tax=Brassica cretica TaxID=69181 RepID=A0A8S9HDV3_BRACR|nr:hypothetical protein F2Q68_00015956 [Brassica cretica]